jgi:hypothetical protein
MTATLCILLASLAVQPVGQEVPCKSEILFETEHALGGAAIGDLDPDKPGNEVAVVNSAGEVWLVGRGEDGWQPERIYKGDGELIMCAIGNADPNAPGNELVGVGMVTGPESRTGAGQAVLIRKTDDGWTAERILTSHHMLHGVAIGDVSSRNRGPEVVVCGFDHRTTLLWKDGERWQPETIHVANDRLKIVITADVVPGHPGPEVIACGSDGNVVALWEGELGWHHEIIFRDTVGQSRVASGAGGVLIGGDDGKVTFAHRSGRSWHREIIARDTGKIRGVAFTYLTKGAAVPELYACGYAKRVIQFVQSGDRFWIPRVIYTAQKPLHHLVVGDVDPQNRGDELVTCGHGGQLVLLTPVR